MCSLRVLVPFDGPVWRLVPETFADIPTTPAQAPEGRFHHSGQIGVYASLSPEGTALAIRRYLGDGVTRVLVPMWLSAAGVADLRGNSSASVIWQDIRADGVRSPTWDYSDAARQAGAQALLYSSRSRPELSHVVIFDPVCMTYVGPTTTFSGFGSGLTDTPH